MQFSNMIDKINDHLMGTLKDFGQGENGKNSGFYFNIDSDVEKKNTSKMFSKICLR